MKCVGKWNKEICSGSRWQKTCKWISGLYFNRPWWQKFKHISWKFELLIFVVVVVVCVICGQINITAGKVDRCGKIFFKKNQCFSGQQFPELFLTIQIITDETLQDTIRYVLILERRTGGNISEAQTVIITWETTGKRYKSFAAWQVKVARSIYIIRPQSKTAFSGNTSAIYLFLHLRHFCAEPWLVRFIQPCW